MAKPELSPSIALLVHAAEPACVKKPLTPLPVTDAAGLAYLHRHAAARAGVAVPGMIFDATLHLVSH
jgi:hypothetical protein